MAVIRWKPYSEIDNFKTQMDRLLDRFYRPYQSGEDISTSYPLVDIKETKDEFILTAEVPGMSKEDIKINITENNLTIKGEKKEEKKEENSNYHRVERRYGSFQRSFTLNTIIDANKIKASCKDGILSVVLPKKEETKPKEIPISIS
ncbi:MAG TPA: Hsp20/alpha crystallin family protein [bacterium]|nr:Hsp20/alpha crystallin family protein [bacterium]